MSCRIRFEGPLSELVAYCESQCVAECCGEGAFSFTKPRIGAWFAAHPGQRQKVREQAARLLEDVKRSSGKRVLCEALNVNWTKARTVEFFSDVIRVMDGIA